jgi:hypothetical protein
MNFFAELCTMTYFNTSKSSRLISRPGKAGSYKQSLIQQIAHAAFDLLAIITSSFVTSRYFSVLLHRYFWFNVY